MRIRIRMRNIFFPAAIFFLFSCGSPYEENHRHSDSFPKPGSIAPKISAKKNDSLDTTLTCNYNTVYMKVLKNGKLLSKTEFQHEVDTVFYDNGKPQYVREGP